MTTELLYLVLTAILTGCLWIPYVIGLVTSRGPLKPEDYVVAPTTKLPHWVDRANRAHVNAVESLGPFAAVVLTASVMHVSSNVTACAAAFFFYARLVHAVVHISGFPKFMTRTVIFTLSWIAFLVLAIETLRLAK